jgi:hypothetical protein
MPNNSMQRTALRAAADAERLDEKKKRVDDRSHRTQQEDRGIVLQFEVQPELSG